MSQGFARSGWPRGNEGIMPTNLVASATPHTKGSWTQIDASAAKDVCGLTIAPDVVVALAATDTSMLMDIGIGGAGSETVVVSNVPVGFAGLGVPTFLPIRIPAGTRIAARIQAVIGSDIYAPNVVLHFGGRPGGWGGYSIAETIGVNTATSGPTVGDLADNAWTEAIASTANPYRALTLHVCGPPGATVLSATLYTVDVGVGNAGSEWVVGSVVVRTTTSEVISTVVGSPFFEVGIPTGSRLAIRKNSNAELSAATIGWR